MSMCLNDLGLKYDTDKASSGHNYLGTYEKFLPYTGVSCLVEIGVFKGGSLRMWEEYYPSAKIIGIDIDPNYLFNDGRIQCLECDTRDLAKLKGLIDWSMVDVVVEDGSHKWCDQLNMFYTLFPLLPSGAVYILEDLHSSKHSSYSDGFITPLEIFRNLEVFRLIDNYEWFDNPYGNQGIGSISLMMRKK